MRKPMPAARGFTLTELTVVLAISAILTMAGAPAMGRLLGRSRAASAEADIAASLRHARTAAIMHNGRVIACPSTDGRRCDDSSAWQRGWILADDADHDGQPDAGAPIIAIFHALPTGTGITSSQGRKLIAFHPNGTAAGSNVRFTICQARSGDGISVVLSNAGRVRTTTPGPQHLNDCLASLR